MMTPQWWREAVCYQIYPRSFADSNGDGIGDLGGIVNKLDYLQELGVTALWISPFYPSAQLDWGYDISDYTGVHPDYGTLDDVDRLIAEAHRRGIRILLDMVLNHTSDQHEWFQQSRASRDSPYRDWYIWRDGDEESPPNDWESIFGGSAWQWDEETGQYYYHFFFTEQPDLNWRNPEVKAAMFDAMRFWLDRGIDGFRLDAIGSLFEDESLTNSYTDASLEEMFIHARTGVFENWDLMTRKMRYQMNLPEIHELLRELREMVDSYGDRVLLGESSDTTLCGPQGEQIHSVFNFDIIDDLLNAPHTRYLLSQRMQHLPAGAQDCNTLSNHDRRRSFSVYGGGEQARAALALITFIRGTPVYYYGEEIGMENLSFTSLAQIRDAFGTRYYHILRERYGVAHNEAFDTAAHYMGRDGCRTPMQWSGAQHAGFSPVQPWLPVHPNFQNGTTVVDQQNDPKSMLAFFRQIVRVRQQNPALRDGAMNTLDAPEHILIFERKSDDQICLVVFNLSPNTNSVDVAQMQPLYHRHAELADNRLQLAAWGIFVGEVLLRETVQDQGK
jgi:alpha-glucosidase